MQLTPLLYALCCLVGFAAVGASTTPINSDILRVPQQSRRANCTADTAVVLFAYIELYIFVQRQQCSDWRAALQLIYNPASGMFTNELSERPTLVRYAQQEHTRADNIGPPARESIPVSTCILLGSVMCLYSRSSCSEISNCPLSTTARVSTRVTPPSPPSVSYTHLTLPTICSV